MMDDRKYSLAVLEGDGIGPEIVSAARRCAAAALERNGLKEVLWQRLPFGRSAIETHGTAVPDVTFDGLARVDGWLLGPHDSASYPGEHRTRLNPSGTIRRSFELFANVRPARTFPGVDAPASAADLVIVRENTEGFYADRNTFAGTGELMPTADVAIMHGIITRAATERIAHQAFRLARTRRRRVTIVHKANVLVLTTGLFRDVCRDVGAAYPDVVIDEMHIDAAAARLVRHAADFDVIVTENMFGDILSDVAGEATGSLGTAPSLNASTTTAMAQAAHGSAPTIAGQDIANPIAMIMSAAMLLEWLAAVKDDRRFAAAAGSLTTAVEETVLAGTRTPDLGGVAGTEEFTDAVISAIA